MSALTDRIRHELTVLKAEGLPSMYVKLEDMEALLSEAKAVGAELPELPKPFGNVDEYEVRGFVKMHPAYSADQMRNYGTEAVRAALASSPALPEQGWVSVDDRLPDRNQVEYLVWCASNKCYYTAHLQDDDGDGYRVWRCFGSNQYLCAEPSHWLDFKYIGKPTTPPAAKEQEKQNG